MVVAVAVAACSAPADAPSSERSPAGPAGAGAQPYPYTTPTPASDPSILDGIYVRTITRDLLGPPGKCVRCPPYRLAEGDERLSLDRGAFRISQGGGHLTVGHFEVSGRTITFFNDPNCPTARGTYRWTIQGSALSLVLVEDDCAFGNLRSRYLTALPWVLAG